jgi:hypothetical protein
METKDQFRQKLLRRNPKLSKADVDKRWEDHERSVRNGSAAGKASSSRRTSHAGTGNAYLNALLNPEGVKGIGVPDEVVVPTAKVQSILQTEMTFDSSGNFTAVISPDFNNNLLMYEDGVDVTDPIPVITLLDVLCSRQEAAVPDIWGTLTPRSAEHRQDQTRGQHQRYAPTALMANGAANFASFGMARPLAFEQATDIYNYPYRTSILNTGPYSYVTHHTPLADGNVFVTLTCEYINWAEFLADPTAVFTATLLSSSGTNASAPMLPQDVSPTAIARHSVFQAVLNQSPGEYYQLTLTYRAPIAAGVLHMHSLCVQALYAHPMSFPFPREAIDSPLAVSLNRDVVRYRPVSMSVLVTYFGNMLDNSLISIRHVCNGADAFDYTSGSMFDAGTLAEQPNSYSGPLQKGVYGVWSPASLSSATRWREPFSLRSYDTDDSFIVVSGNVPSVDARSLRVRVVLNLEFVTNSMLYTSSPYLGVYDEMPDALRAFAMFAQVGENSSHVKRIFDFLSNIARLGGKMAWKNRANLARAVGTAQPEFASIASAIADGLSLLPD